MAMKQCKECGTPVSDKAKACPQCGVDWPTKSMNPGVQGCVGCLGIFVVLAVIGSLIPTDSSTTSERSPTPSASSNPGNPMAHAAQPVNLRSGPSTGSEVVRLLDAGEEVHFRGALSADWVPVVRSRASSDTLGYVASDYLRPGPQPGYVMYDVSGTTSAVTGKIRNLTGRSLDYAQVTCILLNDAGNQVGSTFDNVTNLDAGRTWEFHASVFQEYSRYRCEQPEGF